MDKFLFKKPKLDSAVSATDSSSCATDVHDGILLKHRLDVMYHALVTVLFTYGTNACLLLINSIRNHASHKNGISKSTQKRPVLLCKPSVKFSFNQILLL